MVHGLIICIMMTERKFQFWNLKSFFYLLFLYLDYTVESWFSNISLLFGIRSQYENDVGGVYWNKVLSKFLFLFSCSIHYISSRKFGTHYNYLSNRLSVQRYTFNLYELSHQTKPLPETMTLQNDRFRAIQYNRGKSRKLRYTPNLSFLLRWRPFWMTPYNQCN